MRVRIIRLFEEGYDGLESRTNEAIQKILDDGHTLIDIKPTEKYILVLYEERVSRQL